LDTFSHNTALVDGRPQRRKWGKSGGFMPDAPLTDYSFETQEGWDRAWGVYDGAYGMVGASDSYPYGDGSTFYDGWVTPATHYRRVFYLHPDIIAVSDTLVPHDGQAHDYELRWQLDSTEVGSSDDGFAVATRDEGKPNLAVVPLETEGLGVEVASAQTEPQILGWNFHGRKPTPATCVRHTRTGADAVRFLTLLLPIRAGETLAVATAERIDDQTMRMVLTDGRTLSIIIPADPQRHLSMRELAADEQ
jgi:hypothetical protein